MRWCSVCVVLASINKDERCISRVLHIRIDAQGAEESASVFDTSGICRRTE